MSNLNKLKLLFNIEMDVIMEMKTYYSLKKMKIALSLKQMMDK